MALTDQTFVIETVAASGADHASLSSFASSFNGSSLDLVTAGTVAVALVDSFVDTGGRATFGSWTTDSDNIIIVSVPLALPLDTGAGTFTQGETVTGGTSGATAMVIDQDATYHGVGDTNSLIVSFISGVFSDGETITGGTSAATGTVNGSLDASLYHGGISRAVNGGTGYLIDGGGSASFGVIRLTGGAEYFRAFGLEITGGASGGVRQASQSVKNENDVQQYWNCISRDNSGTGFLCNSTETLFVNCLSYANTSDGFSGTNSGNEGAAYFCEAYNNGGDGFTGAGRRIMRNCVSGGNTDDDFAFETNEDYCLSSDATATGTNSKASITFTTDTAVTGAIFTNLTAGSEDFTPQAATGGATQELEDAGVAVPAYGADIVLNERSNPPELGAFELVAAAGGAVDFSGTIAALSAAMAAASLARGVAGTSSAASSTTASGSVARSIAAAFAASSAASASVSRARTVEGSADAASNTSAAASVARGVAGTSASVSAASGFLARLRGFASTSAAVSALSGSLSTASGTVLAGVAAATSALSGSLSRAARVAGVSASSSVASGALARARVMAGQIASASGATVSAGMARAIGGVSAALSTLSGALTKAGEVILYPAVTIQALLQTRASIVGSIQEAEAIAGAMIATARIVAYIPSVDGARRMSIENRLLRLYNASQITLAATVRDADGEAVDITGWSFDWKLVAAADRQAVETPADVSLSTGGGEIVVTDATAGEVEVRIPNGSFDGLTGNHRWQLIGTDGQSREWVVSTGPMHFWPTL